MLWKYAVLLIGLLCMPEHEHHTKTDKQKVVTPASGITLFLCGDVMPGRGIDQVFPLSVHPRIYESYVQDARDYVRLAERQNGLIPKPIPYTYIWGDALEVWREIDPHLKLINLETSVTSYGEPWPEKPVQYRMHPANIAVLTSAGIDFVSLANNHTLDWNLPGLQETLQTLRKAGIRYAGAGHNLKEARTPAILQAKGNRVIVLAYGSETSGIPEVWAATARKAGINLLPDLSEKTVRAIRQQVREVRQPGDVVVFSVHWGSNWGYALPDSHRRFAHWLIDSAGVDIIQGHSSHHPRGIEVYKDKLILYGAGDFINDYEGISGHDAYRGDLTLMYFPTVDAATGKLTSLKLVPMQIRKFRLNHASVADAKWLADVLGAESRKFGTDVLQEDGSLLLKW